MSAHPWRPEERSWTPAALYNAMVAPFTGYGLKGVIWYQGETNSAPDRAPYYADLFKTLIADWRADFAQGDLPFLYAQISSFESPAILPSAGVVGTRPGVLSVSLTAPVAFSSV